MSERIDVKETPPWVQHSLVGKETPPWVQHNLVGKETPPWVQHNLVGKETPPWVQHSLASIGLCEPFLSYLVSASHLFVEA